MPPVPPVPPNATAALANVDAPAATVNPALPPPPPSDCAITPTELSPNVTSDPEESTTT
ncbi:hypothetical protein D3C80_1070920 [compost metagenome]